jgi:hypothetical protein
LGFNAWALSKPTTRPPTIQEVTYTTIVNGGNVDVAYPLLSLFLYLIGELPRILEAVSKPHLRSDGYVAALFKMLTYYRICSAFSLARALPSNLI